MAAWRCAGSEQDRAYTELGGRTGDGRCKRCAAIRSPGGSNATTGAPNVTPRSEARAPPSEWPIIQIFAFGYMSAMSLYRFCSHESLLMMTNTRRGYRGAHNTGGIKQALVNQSSLNTFPITLSLSTVAVAHRSPSPANARAATAKQEVVIQLVLLCRRPAPDDRDGGPLNREDDSAVVLCREHVPAEAIIVWLPPDGHALPQKSVSPLHK